MSDFVKTIIIVESIVLTAITFALVLAFCISTLSHEGGFEADGGLQSEYIQVVEYDSVKGRSIIYDKTTKVMYISRSSDSSFTPLYNADGTLRLWMGE